MGFGFNNHLGSRFGFNAGGLSNYSGQSFSIAKSFYFDGVDKSFVVNDANLRDVFMGANKTFSFSMCFYLVEINKTQNLFSNWGPNSIMIRIESSNILRCYNGTTGACVSTETVSVGWNFFTFTYDYSQSLGSRSKMYLNGSTLTVSDTLVDSFPVQATSTFFGCKAASSEYLNGYISQFSFTDIVLTPTEISNYYNNGKPKDPQALFGANCVYFFNPDNSGDTAQFSVTNQGITATSINMTNANKSPITPYQDKLADLVTKYGFLNAWSGENIEINGTTTTAKDYASEHDLSNGTVASQPTFVGGDADFNNRPIITFDGIDDYLTKAVSNWRSADTSGVVVIVSKKVTGVTNTLFTSSDASSTTFISFGYANTLQSLKTGSFLVSGSTTINTNDVVVSAYASNGTTTSAFLNGVNDTDVTTSDWFDLYPTQRDDITIGAILRNSPFYNQAEIAFVGYLPYTDDETIIACQNELKTIFGI